MIEQVQGSISPIIIESAVESALLWLLALAFLRWFRVADPTIRAVVFSLPLFLPVAVTTAFHVLVPARPSAMPHFKPLEDFISAAPTIPLPLLMVLFLAGTAGVGASLVLLWRERLAWSEARRSWQRQQQDDSPLYYRCNAVLEALAARLGIPAPRFVLVAAKGAGSLALGRSGYVFVSAALATQLDSKEMEALLAHEMAHIARKDGLLLYVARVCRNLMLFNPLAYLALSRVEREMEQAADDRAVRMGSNRLALASCLLKAYRFGDCQVGVVGAGLLGSDGALERRVRRMMDGPTAQPSRVAWLALGMLAIGATIAFALVL